MFRSLPRGPLAATLVALALLLAWDAAGLDLALARLAGRSDGFAWRNDPALVLWMHEIPRFASWAL
ncbi:MAG: PAP2 family protein, partial [Comamonadaceae bacterium]